MKIKPSQFQDVMMDLIQKEVLNKENTAFQILDKYANGIKEKIVDNSPERTGDYLRGWKVATKSGRNYRIKTIHNSSNARKTIVLEHGAIRAKTGIMPAQPHITRSFDEAVEGFIDELVNKI